MEEPQLPDVAALHVESADLEILCKGQRDSLWGRRRNPGKFLRGPIPWSWLAAACLLPGKALVVALVLWQEAGCRRSKKIRFRLSAAVALGMHRASARRGLRALAAARLVTVRERPGRCSEVTIIEKKDA